MEHPRFGSIMSVTTTLPVKGGDELFTFYGYQKSNRAEFEWYFEELEKVEKEEKKKKKRKQN
jgi:hypothetical protein